MTTKSKSKISRGMLEYDYAKIKGIPRIETFKKPISVRQLFHHKRYKKLRERYVAFYLVERDRWVIPDELEYNLIK